MRLGLFNAGCHGTLPGMGDNFQIIVDRDVTGEEAPRFAERVREWLMARHVMTSERASFPSKGSCWRPGTASASVVEGGSVEAQSFRADSIEITVGRTYFWTPFDELTCRECGARFIPQEGWTEALTAWHEGDDSVTFACPRCGHAELLTEWSGEFGCGFGNLGFTFWNWPSLSASFLREVTELLGHRIVLVRGKL